MNSLVHGPRVLLRIALYIVLYVYTLGAFSATAGPHVRPFVQYTHSSDIFTPPGNGEWTYDAIQAGASLRFPRVEIDLDLSHGIKSHDCNYRRTADVPNPTPCIWEQGTQVSVRKYFTLRGRDR